MSHLIAFHLGPVQEFITTARRTQDWWMGSWLLAHLTRTALEKVEAMQGVVLLPAEWRPTADTTVANTPNHLLAHCPGDKPASMAKEMAAGVRDEWLRITKAVRERFFGDVDQELWDRQLKSFLEIYWAVFADDDSTAARNSALAALDARKRLRNFDQVKEDHRKCSLCGARQELSGKDRSGDARAWWRRLVRKHYGKLRIRAGGQDEGGIEQLCAVCAVKRSVLAAGALNMDRGDGHFPSTSSVAAAPFKRGLVETGKAQVELREHLRALRNLNLPAQVDAQCLPRLTRIGTALPQDLRTGLLECDGNLFFSETLTEKQIIGEFPEARQALLKRGADELGFTVEEFLECEPTFVAGEIAKASSGLRALFRAVRHDDPSQHIPSPAKYFAALVMDGDRMGKFFGKTSKEQAIDLSWRLSQFARDRVATIVERHLGRLVYAGGDDALALLPLEEALPCVRELQQGFTKSLQGLSVPGGATPPTVRVGLVFAHHTAPLDGTLLALQNAGKYAKNQYGGDALCVLVLKRSGEQVQVGTHWHYGDLDAVSLVEQLTAAFRSECLSMKFAQSVAAEAHGLAGGDVPAEARASALRRLARRHSPEDHRPAAEILAKQLAAWAEGQHTFDSASLGWAEVVKWIQLTRFIAGGGRD